MRIALFGGSFDPPHRGHLAIARAAAEAFALDRILFTPAGRQPLKQAHAASYEQRLRMIGLACQDANQQNPGAPPVRNPGGSNAHTSQLRTALYEASTLDAPHEDHTPNYTVDTLERLHADHPAAAIYAIAGADTFHHLHQWHQARRVLELAHWIVVSRPGIPLAIPEAFSDLAPHIHLLAGIHEEVSATELRERLAHGDPCTTLLSPSVAQYIQQHGLYRP